MKAWRQEEKNSCLPGEGSPDLDKKLGPDGWHRRQRLLGGEPQQLFGAERGGFGGGELEPIPSTKGEGHEWIAAGGLSGSDLGCIPTGCCCTESDVLVAQEKNLKEWELKSASNATFIPVFVIGHQLNPTQSKSSILERSPGGDRQSLHPPHCVV